MDTNNLHPAFSQALAPFIKSESRYYYNIRVVRASSLEEAMEAISSEQFEDDHPLCDVVLTKSELVEKLKELTD